MSADKAGQAIDHHHLAVIAEIHLEPVEPAAAGGKGLHPHTALAQDISVAVGQGMAADAVIQQVDLDAFGGLFQQQALQATPEPVVKRLRDLLDAAAKR